MLTVVNKRRETVKPVPEPDVRCLQAALQETGGPTAERRNQELLVAFREQEQWLRCACLGDGDDAPYLGVRRTDRGYHSLVALPGSPAHRDDCAFHRSRLQRAPGLAGPNRFERLAECQVLNLHSAVRTDGAGATNEESSRSASRVPRSTLGSVLLSLMERAGLNQTEPNQPMTEPGRRLIAAGDAFYLAPRVPMRRYTYWGLKEPTVGRAAVELKQCSEWPAGTRPYALMFGLADQVAGHCVQSRASGSEQQLHLVSAVARPGMPGTSGPYLVAVTVSSDPARPNRYEARRGFAIPVLAKGIWLPVDSNLEREVLHEVLGWLNWFESKGVRVRVKKPLFEITTPSGSSVKPDVLLETDEQRVILEIMGLSSDDYRERKTRTIPLMETLADVIPVELAGVAPERRPDIIKAALKRAAAKLLPQRKPGW